MLECGIVCRQSLTRQRGDFGGFIMVSEIEYFDGTCH